MAHYELEREHGGLVAGCDEAGRGPLAGPVVAAAVILTPARLPVAMLPMIDDSKAVKPETRELIHATLTELARSGGGVWIGIAAASTAEIERRNILHASLDAMRRAVHRLGQAPDLVLVDGNKLPPDLPCPARAVIGGDAISLSIAAASIVAKVTRDRIMQRLSDRYPHYGWDRNAGYGTAEHRSAIDRIGPSPHHRMGFGLLKQYR
jgi:ribonuclease HII